MGERVEPRGGMRQVKVWIDRAWAEGRLGFQHTKKSGDGRSPDLKTTRPDKRSAAAGIQWDQNSNVLVRLITRGSGILKAAGDPSGCTVTGISFFVAKRSRTFN